MGVFLKEKSMYMSAITEPMKTKHVSIKSLLFKSRLPAFNTRHFRLGHPFPRKINKKLIIKLINNF